MNRRKKSKGTTNCKMSERIAKMGAGFVAVGDTLQERQNRLTAACNAWNMACAPPEVRQRQLDKFAADSMRFNPAASPSERADMLNDIKALIQRKLQMFPDDRRQIVGARALKVGTLFRIEIASATLQ